ncbi:ATP-binding protein [Halomonas aquatica]|uniref:ATP-binding protein n=1 Tax=Halomonas aquatica TaxID=3151123 RepID=A0ABV1NBC8_9GAMM
MLEAEAHEIAVRSSHDVQVTVDTAQAMLRKLPFTRPVRFQIATAASELARNLVVHAGGGLVRLCVLEHQGRQGFEITAEDQGPGIADIDLALRDGFSTANSLGLGLPGVQRMMDELHFDEGRAVGTRIVARRWL